MTVAIYRIHDDGTRERLGTFTLRGHPNIRRISDAWWSRHPNAIGTYAIARRSRMFGRYTDDLPLMPMEPRERRTVEG
jgi:hypothetical protein